MFAWIAKLFGRSNQAASPRKELRPENVILDDDDPPVMRDAICRAYNTGKTVIGNMNDDGTWDIQDVD